MITLTKVSYIHEADLIRMKLEEAGIECFIADENLTSLYPLYSGAIGGIRIQINHADLDRAKEVLSETYLADEGLFTCPQCASHNVDFENVSKRSAFLCLFLINMPLTWNKDKCTCKDCGHTWKEKNS